MISMSVKMGECQIVGKACPRYRSMSFSTKKSKDNYSVDVIGGGIIGLTSALAFLQSGFSKVQVVAKDFHQTTSHGAGAKWRPYQLFPTNASSKQQQMAMNWSAVTMAWLKELGSLHGFKRLGIHTVSGVELMMNPVEPMPYWSEIVDDYRVLTRKELKEMFHGYKHGIQYSTLVIHPAIFMNWIKSEISRLGGTFKEECISSLEDVHGDIVINCAGLAAGELAGDRTVYPVRGQTVKMYHTGINQFRVDEDGAGGMSYVIPRLNGEVVLGGTAEKGNWSIESDDSQAKRIVERCSVLYPELADGEIVDFWAGLRPLRDCGPRIECTRTIDQKMIVHNYAHGGSGHTIHWGCARHAVQSVEAMVIN